MSVSTLPQAVKYLDGEELVFRRLPIDPLPVFRRSTWARDRKPGWCR